MTAPLQPHATIWSRAGFVLLVNFVSFALLAYVSFRANPHGLYSQEDGVHWRIVADEEFRWAKPELGLSSQIFESLGNIRFPMNFHFMPEFVVPAMLSDGTIKPLPVYTLLACTSFLATFLVCRTIGFGLASSLAATWLLLLLLAPFFGEGLLYPFFPIGPPFVWNAMVMLLMISLFWRIGRAKYWPIDVAALILLAFWTAMAVPGMVAISAPIATLFALAALICVENRRELWLKLATGLLILLLTYVSGLIDFFLGLYLHTAATDFKEIILPFPPKSLDQASILYHRASFGPAGPLLFIFGVAGAIRNVIAGPQPRRIVAATVLLCAVAFAGGGALIILYTSYSAVSPVYYDYLILPFYAAFTVDIVCAGARLFGEHLSSLTDRARWLGMLPQRSRRHPLAATLLLALCPWMVFPLVLADRHVANYLSPPAKTPIIETLQNAIGLTPGAEYRGRVFSAFELGVEAPQNWMQLSAFNDKLWTSTGNDHQYNGLWWYGVPTLFEYNWLLSPYFYRVTRDILARPGDPQMRNIPTLRKVEPALLRLFGVSYIISDETLTIPARLILTQSVAGEPTTLYLYALDGVNLGGYSPTEFVRASDAATTLRLLRSDSDLSRVATVEELPTQTMALASSVHLFAEKGGLRIVATSPATSFLLLPFEYSHCLSIEPNSATDVMPRLVRADFLLTGIVFSKQLDARLSYFTGPFRNSRCRLDDDADFRRLHGVAPPLPSGSQLERRQD